MPPLYRLSATPSSMPRKVLMHTKKAWHFFAFIGCLEVFDYLILPNYNEQSPRQLAGASSLYSWKYLLKVSKFQDIQCISYFAFPILWCA